MCGGSWSRGFALLPRFWAIKQFIVLFNVPGLKLTPFNSVQTCWHILLSFPLSLKIDCFIIAQNVGKKAKPHDHDPPGYFRS